MDIEEFKRSGDKTIDHYLYRAHYIGTIRAIRKTLEFYANHDNYCDELIHEDEGHFAREALKYIDQRLVE